MVVCSSAGPKILAFGSHSSANFQPILDCFISNFKLKCEDSENIKADRVNIVFFQLNQIKHQGVLGTPGIYSLNNYFQMVKHFLDPFRFYFLRNKSPSPK